MDYNEIDYEQLILDLMDRTSLNLVDLLERLGVYQVISTYLDSLGISLSKSAGARYLLDCYALYKLKDVEPSPQMIFVVAATHDRRGCHVRRSLHLLQQKINRLDPHTAQWPNMDYRHWLQMMFQYMGELEAAEKNKKEG